MNLSTKFPVNTKTWTTKTVVDNNYVAGNGDRLLCDTTSSAFTIKLPAAPTVGDFIVFTDPSNTWVTNNLTVDRNGLKINSAEENLICNYAATFTVTYVNVTVGWKIDVTSISVGNPMIAVGDMIVGGAAGAMTRLPAGSDGKTLTFSGTAPSWSSGTQTITFAFNGGASTIAANDTTTAVTIPWAGSVSKWSMNANGSLCYVDVLRAASGVNAPPTVSMVSSGSLPRLFNTYAQSGTAPVGWSSTSFAQGDVVCGKIQSNAAATRATVQLTVVRS